MTQPRELLYALVNQCNDFMLLMKACERHDALRRVLTALPVGGARIELGKVLALLDDEVEAHAAGVNCWWAAELVHEKDGETR